MTDVQLNLIKKGLSLNGSEPFIFWTISLNKVVVYESVFLLISWEKKWTQFSIFIKKLEGSTFLHFNSKEGELGSDHNP